MKTPKSLTITLQADGYWHAWMRREDEPSPFGQHLCCPESGWPDTKVGGPWKSLAIALHDLEWWLGKHAEPTVPVPKRCPMCMAKWLPPPKK